MDKEVLADTLKLFYPSARQQNGERYSKQALINLRSGLNRHLSLPPHNKPWNLMHDKEFHLANKVFAGNLREQKALGLDNTRHKPPLPKAHIEQAFTNYFEPHWNNDPKCLQLKVYFDLGYYMGRRAKEKLRELKKEHFRIEKTAEGREYIELIINEATKKSQGDDHNEQYDNAILTEQPGSPRCPVASFKLYLEKLTDLPELFQQPNPCFKKPNDRWYKRSPVGINQIGKFLSEISEYAGLSKRYTNHCIRSTTVHAMKKQDCTIPEMAFVLKHKSLESIKSYIGKPTLEDKEEIADKLFDFASNENENDVQPSTPPAPKKSKLSRKKKKNTPAATGKPTTPVKNSLNATEEPVEQPTSPQNQIAIPSGSPKTNQQLVPLSPKLDLNVPANVNNNVMQMYKQNPIGFLMGANLNNCTININMPK